MKFYDAFAGVGGFHLGITKAMPDAECVGACEKDAHCATVYKKRFPGVKIDGDIRNVERLPEGTEMLCGGFPCQPFSNAGKRKGLDEERGTLFGELARLAEVSRPRLLFFENVKGLLSAQEGYAFAYILQRLDELGYFVEWQVLNSKNFGVPQNRERVFIIGHLGGEPERKVFPLRDRDEVAGEMGETTEGGRQGLETEVCSALDANYGKGGRAGRTLILDDHNSKIRTDGCCGAVRQSFRNEAGGNGCKVLIKKMEWGGRDIVFNHTPGTNQPQPIPEAHRIYEVGEDRLLPPVKAHATLIGFTRDQNKGEVVDVHERPICGTIKACQRLNQQTLVVQSIAWRTRSYRDQPGHFELRKDEVANQLTTVQKDSMLFTGKQIRRLTPLECERLQGFPDNWTEGQATTNRYKMMGNAVTVNVIEAIAGVVE